MEIREFYGQEALGFFKLCTRLFHSHNTDEGFAKMVENDSSHPENFARIGAFEDDLLAAIEIRPYNVNFDGHSIKMGGIGAVVSSLEARGKGAIKEIYDFAFKKMYDNGQILSHLYPFRGDYYRRFHYEPSAYTKTWHIPTEYLRISKVGNMKLYDASEKMESEVKAIYKEFTKNKNLAITEKSDAFYEGIKPYTTPRFSYVHYTKNVADGFICYHMKQYPDKRQDIEVENFWYTSIDGISGLLSYCASLKDYSDATIIQCVDDLAPFIEYNGGWGKRDSFSKITFNGGSRIINAEKTLAFSDFDGKVTLKINDPLCPWNNDVFTLSEGVVTRGGDADLEVEIGMLSAMLLGRCEKLNFIPNLKIFKNEENIKKLFKPKDMWFDEHF